MKNSDIVYSLNIEDIQSVAIKEISRTLLPNEIKKIVTLIEKKIDWYGVIASSINEELQ